MFSTISRPRRSALFMPGDNPRAQQKACGLPADVIILDLEDAVSPTNKEIARRQVQSTLEQTNYGQREVVVRVNHPATQYCEEDLAALASNPPDAILVPKVESADELFTATVSMNALGVPPNLAVWAMIETPLGIQHIDDIVTATPRLACVVAGTADLASRLRIPHSSAQLGLQYALSRLLLAARANQIDAIDGVFFNLQDSDGLRHSCETGRQMGFDGKSLIHPSQIETTNTVFSPDPESIAHARKVVAAWSELDVQKQGVLVVDDQLIEALHVRDAERLVELTAAIDAMDQGSQAN